MRASAGALVALLSLQPMARANEPPPLAPPSPRERKTNAPGPTIFRDAGVYDGEFGPLTPQSRYLVNAERKLFRGLTNIITSPADTAICPADVAMQFARRPTAATAVRIPLGVFRGGGKSVMRLISGTMEFTTCLLPNFEAVQAPVSYHCAPVSY
jgi:hypothetical protein